MENNSRIYPSNPLGIIATFVFFIEAITASSLHFLKGNPLLLEKKVNFIILFPSLIAFTFFGILLFKREILFAPSDFKNEENFLRILNKIQLEQKITQATIAPPSNLTSVFELVDELLARGEIRNAIRIGRGYLKLKDFSQAKKFFQYLQEKTQKSDRYYNRILINLSYCERGLQNYSGALNYLNEVDSAYGEKDFWFLAAMTYVHFRLRNLTESNNYLVKVRAHHKFSEETNSLKLHYPDFDFSKVMEP